ncbi:MAG: hypothetical protein ABSD56_11500 [Bryobacteraceae bacterium]
MSTLRVLCEDVFDVDLPLGEARLVYADPPYMKSDEHGYGVAPDPRSLVRRMVELGAADAAFVLHSGSPNLGALLPVIEELAPARSRHYAGQPKYRLLAWTKPWRRGFRRPTVAWQFMWEPVVLFFGTRYRHPRNLTEADWICALRDERSANGHPTQKPDELLFWLFERLLAGAQGRLAIDLFAGTGGAAIMATRMGLDAIAVERDRFFAGKILENAALPSQQIPGYLPGVRVNGHGRPVWPTLGHVEIDRGDLAEELATLARQRKQANVTTTGPEVYAGLEEDDPAGEVEAEPPSAAERLHLSHRAHGGILATTKDVGES